MVPTAPYGLEFSSFCRLAFGANWESVLLRPEGEVLLAQLRAYARAFVRLSGYDRHQHTRLWRSWSVEYRRQRLAVLAAKGGLPEVE